MTDYLVIRFRADSTDNVEWVTVDPTGALTGTPAHGDPISVAAAAGDRKIIALVPAASVLRTTADVPLRGTARILQALPFAMEEQLAADVEELHFAAGKRDAESRLPVAVVERLEMEAWLELLAAAGIKPVGMYADSDAVGVIPNTTTLFVEENSLTLCDADGYIAVTDIDGAETTLELWLRGRETRDDPDAPAPPVNILVYVTPVAHAAPATAALITNLQPRVASLDVRVLSDGALPRLASQIVTQPGINLLQGRYAQSSNLATYWPAWRVATALFACLTLTLGGAKLLEISSLRQQAVRLDAAIEQGIRYTFPEVREVRDARSLLESKLRQLGRERPASGRTDFLETLQTVAGAISVAGNTGAKLETINYRSGTMELRVLAPNVEALDTIRRQIADNGALQAEIQSANPEGDGVRGRIQITSPEA
ncbi:MAG: type II secretion system protein GspL [Gammaproteobacteria bacterium]